VPEASEATEKFIVNHLIIEGERLVAGLTSLNIQRCSSDWVSQSLWECVIFGNWSQGLSGFEVFRLIEKSTHVDDSLKKDQYFRSTGLGNELFFVDVNFSEPKREMNDLTPCWLMKLASSRMQIRSLLRAQLAAVLY
jgi:hypothetical protein